jgi:hypothetical protein
MEYIRILLENHDINDIIKELIRVRDIIVTEEQ